MHWLIDDNSLDNIKEVKYLSSYANLMHSDGDQPQVFNCMV